MPNDDLKALALLDNRVLSCYAEARELRVGKMCPPRVAIIYPTYQCNQRCLGCDYASLRSGVQMTRDELSYCIGQFAALGTLSWDASGGGEPTLHPYIRNAMEDSFHKWGMAFGLVTNGTRLHDQELCKTLLEHGSYCRVSIESATEAAFNTYKRPMTKEASFAAVVDNLKRLLSERKEVKSNLVISYKFTVSAANWQDIPAAFDLAEELGVDSLQFKAIRNTEWEMTPDEEAKSAAMIDAGKAQHPNLLALGNVQRTHLAGKCWLSPLAATVDPSGNLYVCFYYRHRQDRHWFGNMFETPLRDLWYGERHMEAIRNIRPAECNAYDCRFHGYNERMGEVMRDGQLEFI